MSLRRGDGRRELGDFVVQVAVIVDRNDFVLKDVFELLEVDDEARGGVDVACHRDLERVVMTVPLAVGALAEDTLVFGLGPCVIPVKGERRRSRLCESIDNHGVTFQYV